MQDHGQHQQNLQLGCLRVRSPDMSYGSPHIIHLLEMFEPDLFSSPTTEPFVSL